MEGFEKQHVGQEVHSGMMAEEILKQEAGSTEGKDYVLDKETGEMVTMEEYKTRRHDRLVTGREQH